MSVAAVRLPETFPELDALNLEQVLALFEAAPRQKFLAETQHFKNVRFTVDAQVKRAAEAKADADKAAAELDAARASSDAAAAELARVVSQHASAKEAHDALAAAVSPSAVSARLRAAAAEAEAASDSLLESLRGKAIPAADVRDGFVAKFVALRKLYHLRISKAAYLDVNGLPPQPPRAGAGVGRTGSPPASAVAT